MKEDTLIRNTYENLKSVQKNNKIFKIISDCIDLCEENIFPLQKEFLKIHLIFSYQHFGFSLFCETSLNLISSELRKITGVSFSSLIFFLKKSKYFLLREINKENFDENFLEEIFSIQFLKKIFSAQKEEDFLTGISIYDSFSIEKIRDISKKIIHKISLQDKKKFNDFILEENEFFLDDYPKIKHCFFKLLQEIQDDPFSLLLWRMESFIFFTEKNESSAFFIAKTFDSQKEDTQKIISLLSLLIPHSDKKGNFLFSESPASPDQLAFILSRNFKSKKFHLDFLKNWTHLNNFKNLKDNIKKTLEKGVKYGIFFKIPNKKKSFSYGVSTQGLNIIKPFHHLLTEYFTEAPH
jgi:hypothetical protein